jgi:hypothetical protein
VDADLIRVSEELAAVVGSAIAARPLLERLLGPTFDYAGRSLAGLLERYGNINLGNIFRRTAERLAAAGVKPGHVNPRVLRAVIEDGSFAADPVTTEYFAGLLAASARGDGSDDRAVTFLGIVRSLTTAQVRLHHLLYAFLRVKYIGNAPLFYGLMRPPRLFIADEVLREAEIPTAISSRVEMIGGLVRESLAAPTYELQRYCVLPRATDGDIGIVLDGTALGAQLFLWVHGQPDLAPEAIFEVETQLDHWERPESRRVGTTEDLETHAAARDCVATVLSLCDKSIDGEFKYGFQLINALPKLREHARFLTGGLYELVSALPEPPELLERKWLSREVAKTAAYLEGRRLA